MTPDQIAGRHAVQTQRCTPWYIYRAGKHAPALGIVPARLGLQTAEDAVAWFRRTLPHAETWALEARPGTPVVVPQAVDGVSE